MNYDNAELRAVNVPCLLIAATEIDQVFAKRIY